MVRAIKKRLKIKSPSRVFAEIGDWTGKGLAEGLYKSAVVVEKAAGNMGDVAKDKLKDTLNKMAPTVIRDIDMQPVIRPVLDLSDVRKGAAKIPGVIPTPNIGINTAQPYANASSISGRMRPTVYSRDGVLEYPQVVHNNVSLTQNNTSPKALSNAEIYRQTKNQISAAKGALTKT
jgi:hypothetical protein